MAVPSPVFQTPTIASALLGTELNEENMNKLTSAEKISTNLFDENGSDFATDKIFIKVLLEGLLS